MRSYRRNKSKDIEEPQEESTEEIVTAEELAETVEAGLSQSELERIRQEAREKAKNTKHEWRMKGRGVLACTSCPFPHRSFIPTNVTMVGIDSNGNPILQRSK